MKRTHCFHLDLAHVDPEHEIFLHAGLEEYRLNLHCAETLKASQLPLLKLTASIPHQATHYAENVALHHRNLTSFWVTSGLPGSCVQDRELVSFGIHFPRLAESEVQPTTPNALMARAAAAVDAPSGTLVDSEGHEIVGWHSVALSIIFTHPEIMHLKPHVAKIVQKIILKSSYFEDAVNAVKSQGKDFARQVPLLDFDKNPVYQQNSDGSQGPQRTYYEYSEATKEAIRIPMLRILREIKNDKELEGSHWRTFPGQSAQVVDAEQVNGDRLQPMTLIAEVGAATTKEPKAIFKHIGPQAGGLKFELETDKATNREFKFSITNEYLRYVSVYIQFLREVKYENGEPVYEVLETEGNDFYLTEDETIQKLCKEAVSTIQLENKKTRFLRLISSIPTFLAIPTDKVTENFHIKMPEQASTARILAGGGFGLAYPSDLLLLELMDLKKLIDEDNVTIASSVGLIFSGIVNLAIPMITLASSTGDDGTATEGIKKLLKTSGKVISKIARAAKHIYDFYKLTQPNKTAAQALGDVGTLLLGLATSTAEIMAVISAAIGKNVAEEALPLIGQAIQAVNITAAAASLAESTAELLASPLVVENTVSFTFDCNVEVKKDPLDPSGFPATAWVYELICKYDKGTTRILQNLPINRDSIDTEPQIQVFNDLPSSGSFTITANFYAKAPDGTINYLNPVGTGTSAKINATSATAQNVEITIKEIVPPLTAETQYTQKRKLTFKGDKGEHVWDNRASLPTATVNDLDSRQNTKSLSALVNINFSQTTGTLGYAWRASGQNVPLFGTDFAPNDDNFYTFQNIGSQKSPEQGLKFSDAGFAQRALVCYELLPPELPNAEQIRANPNPADPKWKQLGLARPPHNFFIQPDANTKRAYVRGINLDDPSRSFDLNQTQSYGYFPVADNSSITSIAVHPAGYLVAIDRLQARLFILQIPRQAVADGDAPAAIFASGKGDRINLLQEPIAVGCTEKGAVLVLDAGARAIQAFDYRGNPLMDYFGSEKNKSNRFLLRTVSEEEHLLDMAVEHRGHLFVLVYQGKGTSVKDYRLDIYQPDGTFLVSATESNPIPAGRLTVDLFRNVYCLTFEAFAGPTGRIEPAVSHLIPSIPANWKITSADD